jgi:outer membrane protein OmpA-like peptidoglycan-associated protein
MLTKHGLVPLVLCLLLLPAAYAQTLTYEEQLSLMAPTVTGETGLVRTVTGDTLRRGDWSFGIYFSNYDYLLAPAPELAPPSRRSYRDMDVDDSRLNVSLGYGLTDRWEVTASVPYVTIKNNAGDQAGILYGWPYVGMFNRSGVGNLHLATKFGLLDPATSSSRLALSLFIDPELSESNQPIAYRNFPIGVGLHWNRSIFAADAIYQRDRKADRADSYGGRDFKQPDEFRFDAGLNVPVSFWRTTNWVSEINTTWYNNGDRTPDDIISILTGLRHWFGTSGWGMTAALSSNLTMWRSDNKSCPIGGHFGLHYAPMHLAAIVPPPPAPVPVPPPPEPAPVTPPPEPVAPPHQPQELRTDEIHFEPGSARLTNIAKAILDDVALRMRQEPRSTAIVIGYTDSTEATGANKDLDRRRAEAVRDYLVSRHGIDSSRITVEARDATEPVGDNATAEGRLHDRRVVIRLILP